jgi:hypothetical protein
MKGQRKEEDHQPRITVKMLECMRREINPRILISHRIFSLDCGDLNGSIRVVVHSLNANLESVVNPNPKDQDVATIVLIRGEGIRWVENGFSNQFECRY